MGWAPCGRRSLPRVSVTPRCGDFQCPHQPDGCSPHPAGLSLSRALEQGSPRPQEHGQVPRFVLPSLERACGGLSLRHSPAYPASPTRWGGTRIPMKNSCGAEAEGLGLATQQAELEAGFSLQALPGGHQCLRTTAPSTSEGPCTPTPWPALQALCVSLQGSCGPFLCEKVDCSWVENGLDADRSDKGRGGRRKTGFPSPGASLLRVGWTDSLGLAPSSVGRARSPAPGTRNLEPGTQNPAAPALLSLHILLPNPAIPPSVHSEWGPGRPKCTQPRREVHIKLVIEMVACGTRGGWDRRE